MKFGGKPNLIDTVVVVTCRALQRNVLPQLVEVSASDTCGDMARDCRHIQCAGLEILVRLRRTWTGQERTPVRFEVNDSLVGQRQERSLDAHASDTERVTEPEFIQFRGGSKTVLHDRVANVLDDEILFGLSGSGEPRHVVRMNCLMTIASRLRIWAKRSGPPVNCSLRILTARLR